MDHVKKILENNHFIFLFLGLLVIMDRIGLLVNFNLNYVGSDDLIFWQSATDYMHGIFHEPYFYGQNYNFMLESLFTIPLLGSGIPYYYAFPIATSIMALFPFFLFATVLFRKGHITGSLFFLCMPVILPIEYGILTSVTRGFVSGLFFSGFLVFCLLQPRKKSSFAILGLSLSLGYIFNPNALVFTLPVGIYLFLKNYKNVWFYLINSIIMPPVLSIQHYAKQFYVLHPDYNVCGMWDLKFSFERLMNNFNYLDKFYGWVTPLWSLGPLVLLCMLIFGIISWRAEWEKGLSILLGLLFIIVSMGINKVNDDLGTVFLSSARMFLGVPLLLSLSFFWSREKTATSNRNPVYVILIMSVSVFFVKLNGYKPVVKYHTYTTNYGALAIKKVEDLTNECSQIASVVEKYNIDLVVFVPNDKFNTPALEFYNYGCPLLEKKFAKTILNTAEKRTWVYLREKNSVRSNILIFGSGVGRHDIGNNPNCELISSDPNMIIIRGNNMETEKLLYQFDIEFIRNWYLSTPLVSSDLIRLKAFNHKYVCADAPAGDLIVANRDLARTWETFSLIPLGNDQCAIRACNEKYFSAELGQQGEITASRTYISTWETFTMVRIDSSHVAFKAANGKYLNVDEKTFQVYANADSITEKGEFEMINK